MAPMNRDALGASLFIGIGMRRRIGIHRNRDAPAHCIHMNRMRRRIVIHRNKDMPAHPIPMNSNTPAYPYSYEYRYAKRIGIHKRHECDVSYSL